MAAGVTIKHKRKTANFADGELAAGEWGLNTNSGTWFFSSDGLTVTALPVGGSANPIAVSIQTVGAHTSLASDFSAVIVRRLIVNSGIRLSLGAGARMRIL